MLVLDDDSKHRIKLGAIVSGGSHRIFRISGYQSFILGQISIKELIDAWIGTNL